MKGKMPEWYYDSYNKNNPPPNLEPEDTLMKEFTITFNDPPVNNFYQFGIHVLNYNFFNVAEYKIRYASFDWPDPLYTNEYYSTISIFESPIGIAKREMGLCLRQDCTEGR